MQVLDLHISTIPLNPPKHESVRATREHSTPPPYPIPVGWVHATLAISHSQCVVIFSHNRIAEVPRLTEGMQLSTFNLISKSTIGTVLNRYRRSTTSRQHSCCKLTPTRSHINQISCSIKSFLRKENIASNDELIIRLLEAKQG
jgi:hypothetical protein